MFPVGPLTASYVVRFLRQYGATSFATLDLLFAAQPHELTELLDHMYREGLIVYGFARKETPGGRKIPAVGLKGVSVP